MASRVLFYLSAIFLVALTGCSSSTSYVLMPEYERGAERGTSVALLPLGSNLNVSSSYSSAVEELDTQTAYFTDKGHALFERLFYLSLQEAIAGKVVDATNSFDASANTFTLRQLPLPSSDSLHVLVPGGPVQLEEESADFLLLIDQLVFAPRTKSTKAGMIGSTTVKESIFLGVECQYVLYDNQDDRVAAYGTFEGETRTLNPSSTEPYQTLFSELATHIVTYSPIAVSTRVSL